MNGLLLALIVYMIGWMIARTLHLGRILASYDEPGEDEDVVAVLAFFWPIMLAIVVITRARELQSLKARQQYQDS